MRRCCSRAFRVRAWTPEPPGVRAKGSMYLEVDLLMRFYVHVAYVRLELQWYQWTLVHPEMVVLLILQL